MKHTADIDNISGKVCSPVSCRLVGTKRQRGGAKIRAELKVSIALNPSAAPSVYHCALASLSFFSPPRINYYVITHYNYYRLLSQLRYPTPATFSPSRTLQEGLF